MSGRQRFPKSIPYPTKSEGRLTAALRSYRITEEKVRIWNWEILHFKMDPSYNERQRGGDSVAQERTKEWEQWKLID